MRHSSSRKDSSCRKTACIPGFDAEKHTYDKSTWNYEGGRRQGQKVRLLIRKLTEHGCPAAGAPPPSMPEKVAYDPTLQHPRCVYQLLKQQYSRYTPEMVERITGIPKDQIIKAADLFTSIRKDGATKQVATIIYAVGWTQHSSGTQTIRGACMLQLLMGNVGRAGGGVNALRGHSNIQGATDIAGIFDILPGYLKVPTPKDADLKSYLTRITPKQGETGRVGVVQLLVKHAEIRGVIPEGNVWNAATKENDFAFHYLPKVDRNYSWTEIWNDMYDGKVQGFFAFGMNGVAIGPNSEKNINALKKADFLVVCEIYPDETSEFWNAPGTTPEEMKQINTRFTVCQARDSQRRTGLSSTRRAGYSGSTPRFRLREIANSTRRYWHVFPQGSRPV